VTNALNIGYEKAIWPQVKIVMTGGMARPQTFDLVGPLVSAAVETMSLDWAVIGVDGLDDGLLGQASRNADADALKMGVSAFGRICGLSDLTIIVTDEEPPTSIADAAWRAGGEIILPA
jgi:DeoR family transcriptional regulator of aga operon